MKIILNQIGKRQDRKVLKLPLDRFRDDGQEGRRARSLNQDPCHTRALEKEEKD